VKGRVSERKEQFEKLAREATETKVEKSSLETFSYSDYSASPATAHRIRSNEQDNSANRDRKAGESKEINREESSKELTGSEFLSLRRSPIRASPSYRVSLSSHSPTST